MPSRGTKYSFCLLLGAGAGLCDDREAIFVIVWKCCVGEIGRQGLRGGGREEGVATLSDQMRMR